MGLREAARYISPKTLLKRKEVARALPEEQDLYVDHENGDNNTAEPNNADKPYESLNYIASEDIYKKAVKTTIHLLSAQSGGGTFRGYQTQDGPGELRINAETDTAIGNVQFRGSWSYLQMDGVDFGSRRLSVDRIFIYNANILNSYIGESEIEKIEMTFSRLFVYAYQVTFGNETPDDYAMEIYQSDALWFGDNLSMNGDDFIHAEGSMVYIQNSLPGLVASNYKGGFFYRGGDVVEGGDGPYFFGEIKGLVE